MSRDLEARLGWLGVLVFCLIAVLMPTRSAEALADGKQILVGYPSIAFFGPIGDHFTPPGASGTSNVGGVGTAKAAMVRFPMGTLSKLKVQLAVVTAPVSGHLVVTIIKQTGGTGSIDDTLLTCTVEWNDPDLGCEDTVNAVTLDFGDQLGVKYSATFDASASWSFTYTLVFD